MRLLELLKKSVEKLEAAGIDDALPDAEMLVFHAAGIERLDAYMNNPEITASVSAKVSRFLGRRIKREPVQYITGHVEFLGMKIMVGRGVLVPRPETELLVEEVVKTVISNQSSVHNKTSGYLSILDLCTGSGCIALALAREFSDADVKGTDLSAKALGYAKKNAQMNSINNVRFLKGSLFNPVKKERFDIITANPPYIKSSEISTLQREIRDWEPVTALDGGSDGMDFYRRILSEAGSHLNPGGYIFMELGYDQSDIVRELASGHGLRNVVIVDDYGGVGRILMAMV